MTTCNANKCKQTQEKQGQNCMNYRLHFNKKLNIKVQLSQNDIKQKRKRKKKSKYHRTKRQHDEFKRSGLSNQLKRELL